ncbi:MULTISPECIES: hypothetical protein [Bacillus]|uniref:hypothetical protein n=1 Tax=Bacillus TaxID=1386 RepID=UPI000BB79D69|nr:MULTISPECIES: hypothetical protein [Bacillus]
MDTIIYFLTFIVFSAFLFFLSIPFYKNYLRVYSRFLFKRLRVENNFPYTFEQIVFFFTRPSLIPALQQAEIERLEIELEFKGILLPCLKGVRIFLHDTAEEAPLFLAYLSVEDFRSPTLDKLLKEEKISPTQYVTICSSQLTLPAVQEALKEDVIKQLKMGRYASVTSE